MVRTQIQLTEDQSRFLKMLAARRGVSVAELIRQSVDRFIRSAYGLTMDERRQLALSIIGIAGSDVSDLSENHDKYLAEAYGDFGR